MRNDIRIEGVSATSLFATQAAGALVDAASSLPGNAPASDTDPLSALQWNMRQIHAPEAHAITGGSPMVVVGNIDTGIETTHPDLAANIDFANSVSAWAASLIRMLLRGVTSAVTEHTLLASSRRRPTALAWWAWRRM